MTSILPLHANLARLFEVFSRSFVLSTSKTRIYIVVSLLLQLILSINVFLVAYQLRLAVASLLQETSNTFFNFAVLSLYSVFALILCFAASYFSSKSAKFIVQDLSVVRAQNLFIQETISTSKNSRPRTYLSNILVNQASTALIFIYQPFFELFNKATLLLFLLYYLISQSLGFLYLIFALSFIIISIYYLIGRVFRKKSDASLSSLQEKASSSINKVQDLSKEIFLYSKSNFAVNYLLKLISPSLDRISENYLASSLPSSMILYTLILVFSLSFLLESSVNINLTLNSLVELPSLLFVGQQLLQSTQRVSRILAYYNSYIDSALILFSSQKRNLSYSSTKEFTADWNEYIIAMPHSEIRFKRAKKYLITGPSGSGKSTFLQSLISISVSDLYDFNRSILTPERLFGFPYCLELFQSKLGYVPQFPVVLNASLYENITLTSDLNAINYEKFLLVLDVSACSTFLDASSTNTILNQDTLSGGQCQRLGLARALYHMTDVLILDEATSALDQTTESNILSKIQSIFPDLCIIFVTHKVDLLSYADYHINIASASDITINKLSK